MVDFSYDANPYDPAFSQYTQGRLAAVSYKAGIRTAYEMYSYHWAGGATKKRLRIAGQLSGQADLDGVFSFDNEGRTTSLTYPLNGGTLTYAYDQMGRPKELTQQITNDGQTWTRYHAKNVL